MFRFHEINNIIIAELTDESFIISQTQDALDIMGEAWIYPCSMIIVPVKNLHPNFFKLHTGLAGDILQKFSNYNIKLAIIGDFSKYKSKNLHDFICESNKGNRIFFMDNIGDALYRMAVN